jgi:hypothetical protein
LQYDALGRFAAHTDGLGHFTLGYLGETGQMTSRMTSVGSTYASTLWAYSGNSADRRLNGVYNGGWYLPLLTWHSYTSTAEDLVTSIQEGCYPGSCSSGSGIGSWSLGYDNSNRLLANIPGTHWIKCKGGGSCRPPSRTLFRIAGPLLEIYQGEPPIMTR